MSCKAHFQRRGKRGAILLLLFFYNHSGKDKKYIENLAYKALKKNTLNF